MGVIVENTFNQSQLVDRILARPELLDEILDQCRRTTVAAHLAAGGREVVADRLREELPELAERTLFLDRQGNPMVRSTFRPVIGLPSWCSVLACKGSSSNMNSRS